MTSGAAEATRDVVALVVAKAPVVGAVKTRLGAEVGMELAARLAAAALVDTLERCAAVFGPARCHLAVAGDLASSVAPTELHRHTTGWTLHAQRGDGLATRLRHAHEDAATGAGGVVQVGMDTPHLDPEALAAAAATLRGPSSAVLGPAVDGGWWLLGVGDPALVAGLEQVPMSTAATGDETVSALRRAGATVETAAPMRDVDTAADAEVVAAEHPDTRFAHLWRARGSAMTAGARELFADVFTAALRGDPCSVVGLYPVDDPVTLRSWARTQAGDDELLDECVGATLDVGCGPGRMTAALGERGHLVLGVDIVPEAVQQTRRRGACALHRDVFEPLPAEGRWDTALLADGNIGIGGDPVALLGRLHSLLAPGGRVVCDLSEPGTGLHRAEAYLECRGLRSPTFPWTLVGPEAVPTLAARTGFAVRRTASAHGRWFAVLERGDAS